LVLIDDNGFGLWNSRLVIPPECFDAPSVVVPAENCIAEVRDTPKYYPLRNTIYPILGLVGSEDSGVEVLPTKKGGVPGYQIEGKTHFILKTAADLVRRATNYGAKHCLIIYAFTSNNGGNPPFDAENGTSFYIDSLPMN
jgi:hypothetical protein